MDNSPYVEEIEGKKRLSPLGQQEIIKNLRLAYSIANSLYRSDLRTFRLGLEDAKSAAVEGLINGILRWNPVHISNSKWQTYARHWVRRAVQEASREGGGVVNIPSSPSAHLSEVSRKQKEATLNEYVPFARGRSKSKSSDDGVPEPDSGYESPVEELSHSEECEYLLSLAGKDRDVVYQVSVMDETDFNMSVKYHISKSAAAFRRNRGLLFIRERLEHDPRRVGHQTPN